LLELSFSPLREAIYWNTNFVETYANFVVSNWNTETGKWSAKITGTIARVSTEPLNSEVALRAPESADEPVTSPEQPPGYLIRSKEFPAKRAH